MGAHGAHMELMPIVGLGPGFAARRQLSFLASHQAAREKGAHRRRGDIQFIAVARRILGRRQRAQEDPAIGVGRRPEFEPQLEVGEIAGGAEQTRLAGRHAQYAVHYLPVGLTASAPAKERLTVEQENPARREFLWRELIRRWRRGLAWRRIGSHEGRPRRHGQVR